MVTEVAPGCTGWRCRSASTGSRPSAPICSPAATGATRSSTAASPPPPTPDGDPGPGGTAALEDALLACGSGLERIERLVVTHAHIDHFGLAGEVVRRSGGELLMHRSTELDLAKYADPEEAVDRRELMLADHGLYGPELTESSRGLCDWLPVMPSIGRPSTLLDGGERITVGDRSWEVVHTPGHSPGHICLWSATDRLLCSGDHLLQVVSPPVTFERGFETDPMGSYLESLERVGTLAPDLVLPGHGAPFRDGARRARFDLAEQAAAVDADPRDGGGARAHGHRAHRRAVPDGHDRRRSGTSPWPRSSPTSPTTRCGAFSPGAAGPTACSCGGVGV